MPDNRNYSLNELEQRFYKLYPDMVFWRAFRVAYPQGLDAGYAANQLKSLWTQYKAQTTQPVSGTTPTDTTTGVVSPEDDLMKRLAMLDIEKFDWQKTQAERDWASRNELNPYQNWQIRQSEQSRLDELEKARLGREGETANFNAQRLMSYFQPKQDELNARIAEMDRQTKSQEFENIKRDVLSSAQASPRDWIGMYKVKNTQNPYAPARPVNQLETIQQYTEEAKRLDAALKTAKELEKDATTDPNRSLSAQERQMIDTVKAAWANTRNVLLNAQIKYGQEVASGNLQTEGGWAAPRTTGVNTFEEGGDPWSGTPKVVPSSMPAIPDWLQKASGLTGNVPEQRTDILRPSGQSWNQLAPTQQSMYAGLADWSSTIPFEDIMSSMQKQLPQNPSLGNRWSAARQRV